MRNRFHLSALYYYFWSVPFFFSAEPAAAYIFAGLLGVLATALTFEIGRRVAGGSAGVAAALVFATMPLAVIDGRMAWAPAALPVLSAAVLLALVIFVDRATWGAAIALAVLAAVAAQLHLAAASLVLVAAAGIVLQARRLGVGGVVAAGAAGAVVSLPTLWALSTPIPAAVVAAPGPDGVTGGRLLDILTVGRRGFAGVSPDPATWPGWVDAWISAETIWVGVVMACAAIAVVRIPSVRRPSGLSAVLGTLLVSALAVLFLPWEAWHYYLDVGLVPAAVVVGLVAATALGRSGWWLLLGAAAGRTVLLLWWIHAAHAGGYVGANLELLRLGGPRPEFSEARARIPTVAARDRASGTLVHGLGILPPSLWERAHGPGFSDLDTDNGFFFERAAARRAPAEPREGHDVLVAYRGQVPVAWRNAQPAPIVAGPFEVFRYAPLLERSGARLLGCGGGPPPVRPATTPLAYGDGGLKRSAWPCDDPVVLIPLGEPSSDDVVVRVFARLDGPGRIVELDVEPPASARVIGDVPPGLGRAIEIHGGTTLLRIGLSLDGPASLDLFELVGRR